MMYICLFYIPTEAQFPDEFLYYIASLDLNLRWTSLSPSSSANFS